ncbi:uncharacterized protein LOC143018425 [Oratosquilla oratoria]|uniref:uncharacterized protein LOC143018425 n=1 Tax=Oratosquilla oratoria TaxID=337810 RepID=UPI003F75F281
MTSLTPLLFTKRMCPPGRDPSRDPGVSTPLQVMSSEDVASVSSAELTLPHIAREVLRRKALGRIHVEVSARGFLYFYFIFRLNSLSSLFPVFLGKSMSYLVFLLLTKNLKFVVFSSFLKLYDT